MPASRHPALKYGLFGGLALAAAGPAAAADTPPGGGGGDGGRSVELLFTGALGGIGSGTSPFSAWGPVQAAAGEPLPTPLVEHGVWARGDWLLWTDGRVSTGLALLEGPTLTCEGPSRAWAVRTPTDLVLWDGGPPTPAVAGLLALGEPLPRERWLCEAPDGVSGTLIGPVGERPAPRGPVGSWELRRSLVSGPVRLVSRPVDDPPRLVAAAEALLEMGADRLMYVDSGDFLDGASAVRPGALSMHRPLGLEALARLRPVALAPGPNELIAGLGSLKAEAADHGLPYLATNAAGPPGLQLPAHAVVERGGVRVAFVAALDPAWAPLLPALTAEGVSITDPVGALNAEVEALLLASPKPDLVVALTTASPGVLSALRRGLRGVDLLLGDPSLATLRLQQEEVGLRPLPPGARAAPLTLPTDGLGWARVHLGGDGAPSRLEIVPGHVFADAPVDAQMLARITGVRAEQYPPLDKAVLPAFPGGAPWPQAAWEALICEAVRQETGADAALIPPLPAAPAWSGPVSALTAADSLALLDTLELHAVTGAQVPRLLDRLEGWGGARCGISAGSIGGRPIDPLRSYQVLTTAPAAAEGLGPALQAASSRRWLDPASPELPRSRHTGTPLTLREAALDRLVRLADAAGPEAAAARLQADPGSAPPPLRLLRLRQLSLSSDRFRGVGRAPFAEVPETLLSAPASTTLGTALDLALEGHRRDVSGDIRIRGTYARLAVGPAPPSETADDWIASTSGAIPGLAWPPASRAQLMPAAELMYDSELSPVAGDVGAPPPPRQADLSLTLGAALRPTPTVKALKLGAFVNRDMAQLAEKPPEAGARLDWEATRAFGPGLSWSTLGQTLIWADSADEDPSDLRLRTWGEARISLPLARWLQVALVGQGLVVRGRVPETARWAFAGTAGVALQGGGALAF